MADKYKMYIGGEWVEAKGGKTFDDYNPATGEVWAQIASGDRATAKAAVDAAYRPCCVKLPGILNYTPRGARRTA